MLGVAVRVGRVLTRPQDRVVLQQAIEHVYGLAGRAGDRSRAEDRELVGGMRVDGDRPVVVAEVPRIEHAQQRAGPDSESLPVRG
jgi:hypothetical protein